MATRSTQCSLSLCFLLMLILIIQPLKAHAYFFGLFQSEKSTNTSDTLPPQNVTLVQQEEPFFCKDYQENYDDFNNAALTPLLKFGAFAIPATLITYAMPGGVNPDKYSHKPLFLLNLIVVLTWSIPQTGYTNEYALPAAEFRKVEKRADHIATVGSNNTQLYKEEPAAGYAMTGLTFAGLNLLMDYYNVHYPSPGPGVNFAENFAIGAKSIGFTSNMASALRTHFKNDYLSKGYTNHEATAAASRDVTVIYTLALAGVVNTGLLNSEAMKGIDPEAIQRFSRSMAQYIGKKYYHVSLSAGLMISAAYESIGSLENYCMANFDKLLPYANYLDSEKLVFCKGIASVTVASITGLALLKYSSGLPSVLLTNAAEASGLVGTEMAITAGRNLFEHPLAKDVAGLTLGGTFTAGSLYINLYIAKGLHMTNIFHGAGLIMLYEGGSALVAHSFPVAGKILALGHTVMGTYNYRCSSRAPVDKNIIE
ncbi:hypothetical protein [Endozoicomonas numazuensis]|uniref:Uncharacterized protein n=1 Tax=Endozoicomonas numazuensis TaxID=1137799 RepID=A0A081N9F6_9GAMM|nr:hypothetical protein [Endozoicomonas numazuensis]KEQ15079.1 hypothetical protein GZ78_24755 [Endozoicomonas numazuensis]